MPVRSTASRRYSSIAALARVLPTRQLIPFWLAIGLTFAAFGFLMDVMARGRSAPLLLVLNVFFTGVVRGGDLVDVVEHDGEWLGYIADVSGHGVASGLVMGMFRSALRARRSRVSASPRCSPT